MGLLVSLHHRSLTHGPSDLCIDCQIASFRWNVHVSASLPPSSVHGLFPIIWTASVCFRGMESPFVCRHLLVGFLGISIGLDCAHPLLVVALHPPLSRCAPLPPTTKEVHTVPYCSTVVHSLGTSRDSWRRRLEDRLDRSWEEQPKK